MDINSALNETDLSATLSLNGSESLFWDGAVHLYTTIYIWIPAAIAILSAIFIFFYPLTTKRMKEINSKLKESRK